MATKELLKVFGRIYLYNIWTLSLPVTTMTLYLDSFIMEALHPSPQEIFPVGKLSQIDTPQALKYGNRKISEAKESLPSL